MNGAEITSPPPQQNGDTRDSAQLAVDAVASNGADAPQVEQEAPAHTVQNAELQGKKRKLDEAVSGSRSLRTVSPPWKKVAVDGPTSFVEQGKRRSARTNVLPLELRPPSSKRQTRSAHQELRNSMKSKYDKPGAVKPAPNLSTPTPAYSKHTRSFNKSGSQTSNRSTLKSRNYTPSAPPTKRSTRKRSSIANDKSSSPATKFESPISRQRRGRSSRVKKEELNFLTNGFHDTDTEGEDEGDAGEDREEEAEELSEDIEDMPLDPDFKPQRLKFKVRMPSLTAQHPNHIPSARRFSSFREWIENDSRDDDFNPRMSEEQVKKEARSRQRILNAINSGTLSRGQSSLDIPDPEPEPPRQYYRHDHFLAHALDMRKRMNQEQARHIREARKLAVDAQAYWRSLQPQPEEDKEREKQESVARIAKATMAQCIEDVHMKWEILRGEIEKQRLVKWELEQEALGKKALNKVLEQSTQLLDARIRKESSEVSSDDASSEDDSGGDGINSDTDDTNVESEDDEKNMSSSESEDEDHLEAAGEDPDEQLTLEELQRKYDQNPLVQLNMPTDEIGNDGRDAMEHDSGEAAAVEETDSNALTATDMDISIAGQRTLRGTEFLEREEFDDTLLDETDESIDMDDDLGSSDEGSTDGESENSEEAASEGDDDNPTNMLGFFSKAELEAVSDNRPVTETSTSKGTAGQLSYQSSFQLNDEDDLDEISLIPDAAEVQTPSASNDGSLYARFEEKQNLGTESSVTNISTTPQGADLMTTAGKHEIFDSEADKTNHTETGSALVIDHVLEKDSMVKSEPDEPALSESRQCSQSLINESSTLGDEVQPAGHQRVDQVVNTTYLASTKLTDSYDAPLHQSSKNEAPAPDITPAVDTSAESPSAAADQNSTMDTNTDSLPATPVSAKPLKTSVPSLLRGTLREYQHYGLDWLAGLYVNGTNGILADEMGLGKTIQTISLLAHLAVEHHIWGPHLIVVPTSVMLNWEMEFKKFLPGFKVMTYYGTFEERKQRRKGWLDNDKWNVVITSYNLVIQDQTSFKKRGWHYLVLDEAHNIKNFRSQRWQTLLSFRTVARLLLTGTPLQNNLTELWSLMFFLMPSDSTETGIAGFAQLDEFSSWFKKPVDQILEQGRDTMDEDARKVVKRLHSVLRPYLLRRLKADVEKQMPAKYEHVIYCKLSKRQRYLYDGFMSRTDTRETLASGNYMSIINCLMQLRKVCNHPDLFETRQIVTSYRMKESVVAEYENKVLLVQRRLLTKSEDSVSLDAVNLLPGANGYMSALDTLQPSRLKAIQNMRWIMGDLNRQFQSHLPFDGSSTSATLSHMANAARSAAWSDLHQKVYLTSLRSQRRPLMNYGLIDRLKFCLKPYDASEHAPSQESILRRAPATSHFIEDVVFDMTRRADSLNTIIEKFAFVTPKVVAPDLNLFAVSREGADLIQRSSRSLVKKDPFHESRMRLSIAFPDKRLLQYDCGKLQKLDELLRKLQAGGHRALIFTQMTKVLDILEQFLNIHGHRYLRLDGSTRIEQRQILTDRFNNDPRILAFILSSRSGGLGINLTGADTVIFYDLDWNPAMDKQCQDRCHRIGQTRDVHIYRFVSEYTIEANILRKANQKRLLDDVIIQEGEFTTDFFHRPNALDAIQDNEMHEADAEASAAMDRVLGAGSGPGTMSSKIFEQAEDKEDIAAAQVAEKELQHADELDFSERIPVTGVTPKASRHITPSYGTRHSVSNEDSMAQETLKSGIVLPRTETQFSIFGDKPIIGVDRAMVEFLEWELEKVPIGPPPGEKKKSKKGAEHMVKRKR